MEELQEVKALLDEINDAISGYDPVLKERARDILLELGRKKMIGGQEDMIEDTAITMAKARGLKSSAHVA